MNGQNRADVKIGKRVNIVLKADQIIRLENEAVTFADENHVNIDECLWRIGE